MEESLFRERLLKWARDLGDVRSKYESRDMDKYSELCSIYLEASPEQRRQLPTVLDPGNVWVEDFLYGNLMYGYMRSVAELIRTPEDSQPLRLGLVAAAITDNPLDWRDLLISLAFLFDAATQAGIDPEPYFKEVIAIAPPKTGKFMQDFLKRSTRSIRALVSDFSDLR
jgi:hypothetical protein